MDQTEKMQAESLVDEPEAVMTVEQSEEIAKLEAELKHINQLIDEVEVCDEAVDDECLSAVSPNEFQRMMITDLYRVKGLSWKKIKEYFLSQYNLHIIGLYSDYEIVTAESLIDGTDESTDVSPE